MLECFDGRARNLLVITARATLRKTRTQRRGHRVGRTLRTARRARMRQRRATPKHRPHARRSRLDLRLIPMAYPHGGENLHKPILPPREIVSET